MAFLLLNQTSISHGYLNTKDGQFMGGANYFCPHLIIYLCFSNSDELASFFLLHFSMSFNYQLLRKISQGQEVSVGFHLPRCVHFCLDRTLNWPEIAPRGLHLPMSPL